MKFHVTCYALTDRGRPMPKYRTLRITVGNLSAKKAAAHMSECEHGHSLIETGTMLP